MLVPRIGEPAKLSEGKVTIEFTISPSGAVINPMIINADPPEIFNAAALEAIQKWKFKPKIVDGKPTEQRAIQTIKFKLLDKR